MTATDTRATASPDSPVRKPERTPRHIMSFSNKLSRWDLKVSPYLYISPFFILFAIVGLFPIAYTAVISFQEWDLVRNSGTFVGFDQYIWILGQAAVLDRRCATRSASSCSRRCRSWSSRSSSPRCSIATSARRPSGA